MFCSDIVHVCAHRWDYALEERDIEIADLKRRLVEAEHRAKEAAAKAAEELRAANSELQVGGELGPDPDSTCKCGFAAQVLEAAGAAAAEAFCCQHITLVSWIQLNSAGFN